MRRRETLSFLNQVGEVMSLMRLDLQKDVDTDFKLLVSEISAGDTNTRNTSAQDTVIRKQHEVRY
jgi:hypothetical protein